MLLSLLFSAVPPLGLTKTHQSVYEEALGMSVACCNHGIRFMKDHVAKKELPRSVIIGCLKVSINDEFLTQHEKGCVPRDETRACLKQQEEEWKKLIMLERSYNVKCVES